MNLPNTYPIIDGFQFSTKLRCGLTFRDLAVQQYEALRRAGGFRNKTWLAPKDSTITIPMRDSYEFQLFLKPGSVIWGYCLIADTEDDEVTPGGTISFNVRDACDDVPLFSEVTTRQNQSSPYPTQYLSKLWVVGKPGTLNVEICSTYSTAVMGQLALFGGEPAA